MIPKSLRTFVRKAFKSQRYVHVHELRLSQNVSCLIWRIDYFCCHKRSSCKLRSTQRWDYLLANFAFVVFVFFTYIICEIRQIKKQVLLLQKIS
ncbi:hypothetical protein COV18_04335 [Candidatus Woesearchaeota archaeon CG10_big_fil_rev_8_21_14_0_10_37_12]|nr:MAG: hypothetical protein COV18_04335 [Candidatus Woesearchaeota archaeon CG10_big_fil_rev_8_21_14_0_10_37_12]